MQQPLRAIIAGTGHAVPSTTLGNDFFANYLDTSDEWIRTRSGIRERHRAGEGETTCSLSAEAARQALAEAGLRPQDLDFIMLATVTPDTVVPSGACWLQQELGAYGVPCMDINAACAGMVYAMTHAATLVDSGRYRNILVVGAETLLRITNMQDRSTCVLFGDGAAAMVISASNDPKRGVLYHQLGADSRGAGFIHMPAGGSRLPACAMSVAENLHTIRMNGREVYKFAVHKFNDLVGAALEATGITPDEIDMIVPHQSNLRIIESVRERLGLPIEKFVINIDRYGNTSSASIGIALDEARRAGRIKPGHIVLMIALGAGLTWGVALLRM
jgi:3-oxoacyl-[acyl-carrier-protein] synthase-3